MLNSRLTVLAGFIAAAALMRLLPHPPNFTPVAAMALFGGAHFASRRMAVALPLLAMLLSDLVLGLHGTVLYVYASMALIAGLGMLLRRRPTVLGVAGAALTGSVLFFVVTNFGVWMQGVVYPLTLAGLGTAYLAAVPFFANTLVGDGFYTAVLFGGFALVGRRWPALRESAQAAALPA